MTAKLTSGKSTAPEIIKVTTHSRDIFLLPQACKSDSGDVLIPRGNHRSLMGRAGLIGKVQINSTMLESDVRKEICAVFAKPMGLTEEHLQNGQYLPLSYLQKAGSGSRSLCVPSVTPSFEWNGKQVSTLVKAGTFLYVLVLEMLPGYEALVRVSMGPCSWLCMYVNAFACNLLSLPVLLDAPEKKLAYNIKLYVVSIVQE